MYTHSKQINEYDLLSLLNSCIGTLFSSGVSKAHMYAQKRTHANFTFYNGNVYN